MNIYQIISIIGLPSILIVVGLIYIREKSLRLGVYGITYIKRNKKVVVIKLLTTN